MRKKYTFVVTVLESEDANDQLRGRLHLIQNGVEKTFTDVSEMNRLMVELIEVSRGNRPVKASAEETVS